MEFDHKEIEARLAAARSYKTASAGANVVMPSVFGDPVDYASFCGTSSSVVTGRKERKKVELADRLKRFTTMKRQNGGIIGVQIRIKPGCKPRWRANMAGGGKCFNCAIAAAEARNQSVEQTTPGVEDLKCDIGAVWRRWGCACGKHRRGGA